MQKHGGTTWHVEVCLDDECGQHSLAEGQFINGVTAKVWMCEQLNLIRFHDRDLRTDSGYSYIGTADGGHDLWCGRLIDARRGTVWEAATVGPRRG